MSSSHQKNDTSKVLTRLGLFGVGLALGVSYYRKQYKPFIDKNKVSSSELSLELNTNDVVVPKDIDKWFEIALSAAYDAGNLIKQFINDKESKSSYLLTKSTSADLVTQIDKKCEDVILSKIRQHFPSHKIIAEESCLDASNHDITDEPTWFIDPIDGTTNFFHGLPFVAVCIGLRIQKIPILGIVHCPILGETFYAILGNGAYLIDHKNNNKKLKISTNSIKLNNKNAMKKALILSEVTYDRTEKWAKSINRRFYHLLYKEKVRAIRMFGSCAISMCSVACGRADIFFEGRNEKSGPKPWDFTAPEIIVHEAGGVTCLPEGKPFDCTKGRILCCNNVDSAKYMVDMQLYRDSDASFD